MKLDKNLLSHVVWLPGYNSKNHLFSNFCYTGNLSNPGNFPMGFHMVYCVASCNKVEERLVFLNFDL